MNKYFVSEISECHWVVKRTPWMKCVVSVLLYSVNSRWFHSHKPTRSVPIPNVAKFVLWVKLGLLQSVLLLLSVYRARIYWRLHRRTNHPMVPRLPSSCDTIRTACIHPSKVSNCPTYRPFCMLDIIKSYLSDVTNPQALCAHPVFISYQSRTTN